MPKFLYPPPLSGCQRHLTLPVVASSAQTLSSFVVTYSVPFASTGNDCSPRRTPASIAWKSTVTTRPRLPTLLLSISVSGECRFSFGVLPKPPQPTFGPEAFVPALADVSATPTNKTTTRRTSPFELRRERAIGLSILLLRLRRAARAARAARALRLRGTARVASHCACGPAPWPSGRCRTGCGAVLRRRRGRLRRRRGRRSPRRACPAPRVLPDPGGRRSRA